MPGIVVLALAVLALFAVPSSSAARGNVEWRSLDGSGNNLAHPDWGEAGMPYARIAPANYADGIGSMVSGPSSRYVSNRIFNDVGQNIFSENRVSQWGWLWAQFLDHTFGLRDETPAERAPIPFAGRDPLERFRDDVGAIDFARTPAASGTGTTAPRQQTNTVSSYIDAFAVYGGTNARLEWLRDGPVDGTLSDNKATLLTPGGYLPRENARGDASAAPAMDLMGPLVGNPANAVVAGDVRANENIALTAVHTLFAREHNRIVSLLPRRLSDETKFEIARRVVGAEEQYITYHEFLGALGVRLARYRGYDPGVNASISNEFATVGYRGHSMIHGELEPEAPNGTYSPEQLKSFKAEGIQVEPWRAGTTLRVPLDLTFGAPDLLQAVGLGPLLKGLADEREYKNDEQIDDSLRSILFQLPKPGARDPSACGEPVVNPACFSVVEDLGAVDIERGRDHGMPYYNALRVAYGLPPKRSYVAITGEQTAAFPLALLHTARRPIDNPRILDFTKLADANGHVIKAGTEAAREEVVLATRRTTLASRLKAIYGAANVDKVDAFVGMLSERHVRGTEFGPLQLAIWKKQFEVLRDGDRFFYANDPLLVTIRHAFGIDYRQSLASIIRLNTGTAVRANVFKVPAAESDS
jgi:hypothetical protein